MAKGIVFQPQASTPLLSSHYGLWVSTAGDLLFTPTSAEASINISQGISGGLPVSRIGDSYLNDSGSIIPKLNPVTIAASGGIKTTNVADESGSIGCIGLAEVAIADGASGGVTSFGRLLNSGTGFAIGDIVYVSKAGGITNSKPSIGVSGFVSGDWIIKVGAVAVNLTNPANKDILVNVSVIGQL